MPTHPFSAELKNLAAIRSFVEEITASLGADADTALDVVQAVDEAATNIILHGYSGHQGVIEVDIERRKDTLVICLRDNAPAFDPTSVKPPNLTLTLEKRPLGGLGIYIIRKSIDEIYHRTRPGGGNELVLIKQLNQRNTINKEDR